MKHTRKDVGVKHKFALLRFTREEGEPILNDAIVGTVMIKERLCPVSMDEFDAFCYDVLKGHKPKTCVVAFGNTAHGPIESGSFSGVPYFNTDGDVKVKQNWTRGNTDNQWSDEWEFLFTSTT